jgi:hypothetical protein
MLLSLNFAEDFERKYILQQDSPLNDDEEAPWLTTEERTVFTARYTDFCGFRGTKARLTLPLLVLDDSLPQQVCVHLSQAKDSITYEFHCALVPVLSKASASSAILVISFQGSFVGWIFQVAYNPDLFQTLADACLVVGIQAHATQPLLQAPGLDTLHAHTNPITEAFVSIRQKRLRLNEFCEPDVIVALIAGTVFHLLSASPPDWQTLPGKLFSYWHDLRSTSVTDRGVLLRRWQNLAFMTCRQLAKGRAPLTRYDPHSHPVLLLPLVFSTGFHSTSYLHLRRSHPYPPLCAQPSTLHHFRPLL